MNEHETLELLRRTDLLKLRGLYDRLREFEDTINKYEPILADPAKSDRHEQAAEVLQLARRGKTVMEEAIEVCLKILDLRDQKEEVLRQLEALED